MYVVPSPFLILSCMTVIFAPFSVGLPIGASFAICIRAFYGRHDKPSLHLTLVYLLRIDIRAMLFSDRCGTGGLDARDLRTEVHHPPI
ncbi:hypothetical protein BD779DRAFT_1108007 [Infundibulicybe gibba]|nr:hypothetical protein BD779DRAFT_1108007 [Infundibulicybe gibba]